jgi:hypothetical protein
MEYNKITVTVQIIVNKFKIWSFKFFVEKFINSGLNIDNINGIKKKKVLVKVLIHKLIAE